MEKPIVCGPVKRLLGVSALLLTAATIAAGQSLETPFGIFGGAAPTAALPTKGVYTGQIAFTSDQGMIEWNGSAWVPFTFPPQPPGTVVCNGTGSTVAPTACNNALFFPTANTQAAIAAAALAASNAGGGTVVLPPVAITITSALPIYSGVSYTGTGWSVNETTTTPTTTGTNLTCSGGGDAFDFNNVDQGTAPTVYATFMGTGVQGVGIYNLTMTGCTYGIKIGALWNMGAQFSEFKNLMCSGCAWSFWIENFIEDNFENLYSVGATKGNMWFFSSGGSALNGGNSTFRKMFAYGFNGEQIRGIVFGSRGTATSNALNRIDGIQIQSQGFVESQISQAATMANTSANITVTNGTAFYVDEPVTVSTTANGFNANQLYFVTSISSNVLTLSNSVGGTNVAATGATATNIITYGYPNIEVIGYGSNVVQPSTFSGLDMEGSGSTRLLIQNTIGSTFGVGEISSANLYSEVTARINNNYSQVYGYLQGTMDIDGSSGSTQLFGSRTAQILIQGQLQGVSELVGSDTREAGGTSALYLQSYFNAASKPVLQVNKNSNSYEIPAGELGFATTQFASGATIGAQGGTSNNVYTGTSGGNVTLPAIPSNGEGMILFVSNPSTGYLTVNTSSSQTINGGGTSYNMPGQSSAVFESANNAGTLYWMAIFGASSWGPTTSSGFGTGASVTHSFGTSSFSINVGTGGTASTGTISLPTTAGGWACTIADVTTPAGNLTQQTGSTVSSATFTNYVRTTGVAGAWPASDILQGSCSPN